MPTTGSYLEIEHSEEEVSVRSVRSIRAAPQVGRGDVRGREEEDVVGGQAATPASTRRVSSTGGPVTSTGGTRGQTSRRRK